MPRWFPSPDGSVAFWDRVILPLKEQVNSLRLLLGVTSGGQKAFVTALAGYRVTAFLGQDRLVTFTHELVQLAYL